MQFTSLLGGFRLPERAPGEPGTAGRLLAEGAQTRRATHLTTWLIGGAVVIVALIVISRLKF